MKNWIRNLVTAFLVVWCVNIVPINQRAQEPKPPPDQPWVIECIFVMIVVVIGGITIYQVVKICKKLDRRDASNAAAETNNNFCGRALPALSIAPLNNNVTLQTAPCLGSIWTNALRFDFYEGSASNIVMITSGPNGAIQTNVASVVRTNGVLQAQFAIDPAPMPTAPAGLFRLTSTEP